jgi:hypothetical protein
MNNIFSRQEKTENQGVVCKKCRAPGHLYKQCLLNKDQYKQYNKLKSVSSVSSTVGFDSSDYEEPADLLGEVLCMPRGHIKVDEVKRTQ